MSGPAAGRPADALALAGLHVYPLKSAGGIAVSAAAVDRFGLRWDRRWMAVDPAGGFLTQRTVRRLALVGTALECDALVLSAPGRPCHRIPFEAAPAGAADVEVWGDRVAAHDEGDGAAAWLSDALERPARLVRMPEATRRPADHGAHGDRPVSFADAYPFLLLSEASLAELNRRMEVPLPMRRFRPNLVIRGAGPFAEDGWRRIRVGTVTLDVVKSCARCAIPTVNQATGEAGREPTRTLATFRRRDGAVHFGQNALHDGPGRLAVGDPVVVLESA